MNCVLPTERELDDLYGRLHGHPMNHGWRVRMRYRFGYHSSERWYEAVVDRLVTEGCKWIDVGGGKSVFPDSRELSKELAARCKLLVGVDPSDNIDDNLIVHQRVKCVLEEFQTRDVFDLATLRMVAEHIQSPERAVESLARLIRHGGHVVVYTPNRWAPVSIAASLIPNGCHSLFTRLLWNTRQEDVFPTYYRMNTRRRLRTVFGSGGFTEAGFVHAADCSTFQRFRLTCFGELCLWRFFHALHITYPENTLLGIYKRV